MGILLSVHLFLKLYRVCLFFGFLQIILSHFVGGGGKTGHGTDGGSGGGKAGHGAGGGGKAGHVVHTGHFLHGAGITGVRHGGGGFGHLGHFL